MRKLTPIPYGSIFFAPMEGITDEAFRKTILKLYPEWDYLATDFLRVPSAGHYPTKILVRHLGQEHFEIPWIKEKTQYQILTSHRAFTVDLVKQLDDLEIPWLDINLGCPSNTVTKNRGGSFLLTDLPALETLMTNIRQNFKGRLSAKVRIGYDHTNNFEESIRLLNNVGVEMITVHGRTKEMMYKEPAKWEFIKRAVEISQVPIIGNGDIWEANDIRRILTETGCHGVMVARGALKSPWMAKDYKQNDFSDQNRVPKIKTFFEDYRANLEAENISQRGLLKQGKSVSRYLVENLPDGEAIRRRLVLSQTVPEFFSVIDSL